MSKSLRIGIDCSALPYPHAGVGQYIKNTLKNLAEIDRLNLYFLYSHRDFELGVTSDNFIKRICPSPLAELMSIRKPIIKSEIFNDRLDIFWGPAGALPSSLPFSLKAVMTVHDLCWIDFPQGLRLKSYIYHKLFVPKFMSRADKIICVSKFTANSLTNYFHFPRGKIDVIYEGVASLFRSKDKKEAARNIADKYGINEDYILSVGTIGPRKNIPRLVNAFGRSTRPLKLLFAGAVENNLIHDKRNIHILGYVDDGHLVDLYCAAKLMTFVSMYEGFGLPVVEAMACGCPCVLSDIPVLREIAGDAAIYVNPYDPVSIADGVNQVVEDRALCDRMVSIGREQVRKFDWANTAKSLHSVFMALA